MSPVCTAPRGMRCTTTGAHSPPDRLPKEWTFRRAAQMGRRASCARIAGVNVEQLALCTENDDRVEVANEAEHPEQSAAHLGIGVNEVG